MKKLDKDILNKVMPKDLITETFDGRVNLYKILGNLQYRIQQLEESK